MEKKRTLNEYRQTKDTVYKKPTEVVQETFSDEYEGGGVDDILKLYQKDKFSDEDNDIIDDAIENGEIDTDTIKEDAMDYIYGRLEKDFGYYNDEDIWSYTDENISNGLTHKENYENLVEYLQDYHKTINVDQQIIINLIKKYPVKR
jgi:hypothetical protein